FLLEGRGDELALFGPIWQTPDEKQHAPEVMRAFIREYRPAQLAVVGNFFSVEDPTEADALIPPSKHPRRKHVVAVWLFRRGERNSEAWSAPLITGSDGSLSLGEWVSEEADVEMSGELFDPVLDAMAEQPKKLAPLRRLFS